MSLDGYTDQQLMDELLERRLERELADEPRPWCHDCRNFQPWKKRGEVPDGYNPCSKRHAMRFHFPEGWEGPEETGYYRRHCGDREQLPPPKPPKPEKPKEPPRGRPDWIPRSV